MGQRFEITWAWIVLTLIALTALTVLVAVGWYFLAGQVGGNPVAAWIIAFFFAGAAIVLVRVIGERRAAIKDGAEGGIYRWYTGWPAISGLFLISALGTTNAAFVIIEGASIVRQDIHAVRTAYDALAIEAARRLAVVSYDQKHKQLDAMLQQLWEEIYNPYRGKLCGVGSSAIVIIDRIRAVVPGMPDIRNNGRIEPCTYDRAREVWQAYQRSAMVTLRNDEAYLQARGPAREEFLPRLKDRYALARGKLNDADASLSGFMGFARTEVQDPLAQTAKDYAADRSQYADLLRPSTTGLREDVDITASQRLGSPAALWQILSKRLLTANAWFYLAFAFGLDLGTVFLLTTVFHTRRRIDQEADAADPFRLPGANPGFLWVNPPSTIRWKDARS